MYKYTVLIFILLLTAAGYYSGGKLPGNINAPTDLNILKNTPTPTPLKLPGGNISEVSTGGKDYYVFRVNIPENADISLIANFEDKLPGKEIAEKNNCSMAINGGFYLENEKPLGLFYADREILGNTANSNIANSFVNKKSGEALSIIWKYPPDLDGSEFVFQTGPYIIPGNVPLKLVRDEPDRRSLLGTDSEGYVYFFGITYKDDLTGGPNLADVPLIFAELENQSGINLEHLVNLDGGSASFFYSRDDEGEFVLPSWSPAGSILCVKS